MLASGALAQVFSCEFSEISKNIFFHRTTLVAASEKRDFEGWRLLILRWRDEALRLKILVDISMFNL